MKYELIKLNVNIESDIEHFYKVGAMIRLDHNNKWANTEEEHNIQKVFKSKPLKNIVLLAKSEKSMARLIAYIDENNQGFMGWYECSEDQEINDFIFEATFDWFKKNNCEHVSGPINGNTWNNYRFNETCSYPLFPGEPNQPLYYLKFWKDCDFKPCQHYTSDVPPKEIVQPMTREELDFLLASNNLYARNLTEEISTEYFEKLHEFYHVCFSSNPLFHAISLDEYELINKKTTAVVNSDHSFLIHDADLNIAGVFISFNDYYYSLFREALDAPKEYQTKKIIIKTLSVSPQYRNKQLGTLMINFIHYQAYQNGFSQVIHALMHNQNLSSVKGKEKFKTEIIREYCLLEKHL